MSSLEIENSTLLKSNREFNRSHLFFFLCSSFHSVPNDMAADKEVSQANKTTKKEMDKMKKDLDKMDKKFQKQIDKMGKQFQEQMDKMSKRFQEQVDKIELQFPSSNFDNTLTFSVHRTREKPIKT